MSGLNFTNEYIIKNKNKLKNDLLKKEITLEKRIAILGGSTTNDIKQILELYLLNDGIRPLFYESNYNSYFEEAVFNSTELEEFNPDIIYIYTTNRNILLYPEITMSEAEINDLLNDEFNKYKLIWENLSKKCSCPIIQNNFEYPYYRIMGNRDCFDYHGNVNYVNRLNNLFYEYARTHNNIYINDINYISSVYGLEKWYNQKLWYMYKYATDILAIPNICKSISNIIKAIYGKNQKSFILDLDNTLWGGVIGDDGLENIKIGNDTPLGQAYLDFQKYLKQHINYGIILNICSKNDENNALLGLSHPDSVLKEEDFVLIKANWAPKNINVENIANGLSLGLSAFVFVDDNPVERDIVKKSFNEVVVPEITNVEDYIRILDNERCFEIVSISNEDLKKTQMYKSNIERANILNNVTNYDEYLESLEMIATIGEFKEIYLDRITQLSNKSNQFNLTTRRYTIDEINNIYHDDNYIKLYGKLVDKFGDNGLVTVVIGKINEEVLDIELWIMSCRVLKRNLENAMMNTLIEKAKQKGIKKIRGYYYKTEKNGMVKDFYKDFEFNIIKKDSEDTIWEIDVDNYKTRELKMKVSIQK